MAEYQTVDAAKVDIELGTATTHAAARLFFNDAVWTHSFFSSSYFSTVFKYEWPKTYKIIKSIGFVYFLKKQIELPS